MFNHAADRIAALIALAAIALAMVSTFSRGPIWYTSLLPVLAVLMLLVGGWWLGRQQPETPFRELAVPAAVATVMPLLVAPVISPLEGTLSWMAWTLSAGAAITLGVRLAD